MNKKRVGIVGVGNVGATLAFTLATKDICSSILLKDQRENITQAMALDISQATNAANSKTVIYACLNDEEFKVDSILTNYEIGTKVYTIIRQMQ